MTTIEIDERTTAVSRVPVVVVVVVCVAAQTGLDQNQMNARYVPVTKRQATVVLLVE
jgi:hypothetical protein